MAEFGGTALVEGAVQMSTEERIIHSLTHPDSPYALTHGRLDKITMNRIRYALSELLALNMPLIQRCLEQIAKDHPTNAVQLLIELAQFTIPKQKAVAVNLNATMDVNPRQMSMTELMAKVVSEQ